MGCAECFRWFQSSNDLISSKGPKSSGKRERTLIKSCLYYVETASRRDVSSVGVSCQTQSVCVIPHYSSLIFNWICSCSIKTPREINMQFDLQCLMFCSSMFLRACSTGWLCFSDGYTLLWWVHKNILKFQNRFRIWGPHQDVAMLLISSFTWVTAMQCFISCGYVQLLFLNVKSPCCLTLKANYLSLSNLSVAMLTLCVCVCVCAHHLLCYSIISLWSYLWVAFSLHCIYCNQITKNI